MVCVRLVYDCDVVVLLIVVQLLPPLIDCSQRTTLPVLPLKVTVPLFPLEHTVVEPFAEPPTDIGLTVMVDTVENATHVPFVILARYMVVTVRFV